MDGDHVPVNLPCGHTFGKQCLEQAFQLRQCCPVDNQFCPFSVAQLSKNFALIEVMEQSTKNFNSIEILQDELQRRQKSRIEEEIRALRSNRGEFFRSSQNISSEIDKIKSELDNLSMALQKREAELASRTDHIKALDRTIKEKENILSCIDISLRGAAAGGGRGVPSSMDPSNIPAPGGRLSPLSTISSNHSDRGGPILCGASPVREVGAGFRRSPSFQPRVPCKHFMKGFCKLGSACNFRHDQHPSSDEAFTNHHKLTLIGVGYENSTGFPSSNFPDDPVLNRGFEIPPPAAGGGRVSSSRSSVLNDAGAPGAHHGNPLSAYPVVAAARHYRQQQLEASSPMMSSTPSPAYGGGDHGYHSFSDSLFSAPSTSTTATMINAAAAHQTTMHHQQTTLTFC